MDAYSKKIDSKQFNVTIDGFPLIVENDFTPNESFNRRETSRHSISGGTEWVARTTYIPRDFTFNTHLRIDPLHPDIYDDTLRLWMSKNVEVVSKEFGGKFNAECIVKKTHSSPNFIGLEIQLIEIPSSVSRIPNDEFTIPKDKVIRKSSNNDRKTNKNTTKKNTNSKTLTRKSNKTKKTKKGNNITRTK